MKLFFSKKQKNIFYENCLQLKKGKQYFLKLLKIVYMSAFACTASSNMVWWLTAKCCEVCVQYSVYCWVGLCQRHLPNKHLLKPFETSVHWHKLFRKKIRTTPQTPYSTNSTATANPGEQLSLSSFFPCAQQMLSSWSAQAQPPPRSRHSTWPEAVCFCSIHICTAVGEHSQCC